MLLPFAVICIICLLNAFLVQPFPQSLLVKRDGEQPLLSETEGISKFPGFRTQIPELKCDPSTKQFAGYFDLNAEKHMYFWFFEARHQTNDTTPIVLWLNGGPGCSSLIGMFNEIGPCLLNQNCVDEEPSGDPSDDVSPNPYAWNDRAHLLFLDQPVSVGLSYGGETVNTTESAAEDVSAFLQSFYMEYPEYAKGDLHLFGESYAGRYIPALGKIIINNNLAISQTPHLSSSNQDGANENGPIENVTPDAEIPKFAFQHLPLKSISLGNPQVNTRYQYKTGTKMACDSTYDPVIEKEVCDAIDKDYHWCDSLLEECQRDGDKYVCIGAFIYCQTILLPITDATFNKYDVRKKCNDGQFCTDEERNLQEWVNQTSVIKAIGSDRATYNYCNMNVQFQFLDTGDQVRAQDKDVAYLLENNIPVLVYYGDADWMCDWYGGKAWTTAMDWSGKEGFNSAEDLPWYSAIDGKQVGEIRSYGNLTYLRVFEAGHLVPMDKPEYSQEMINTWLKQEHFITDGLP